MAAAALVGRDNNGKGIGCKRRHESLYGLSLDKGVINQIDHCGLALGRQGLNPHLQRRELAQSILRIQHGPKSGMLRDDRPNRFFVLMRAEYDDEFIDSGAQKAGTNVFNKSLSLVVEQRFGRSHPPGLTSGQDNSRNHTACRLRARVVRA